MNGFILVLVILNTTYNNLGSGSYQIDSPVVTMQEFSDEKACVFARDVVLRRAGGMKRKLNIVCIPKA